MKKVIFKEKASQDQINWGGNDDPNDLLEIGETYEVFEKDVHSWHIKLRLVDFPEKVFNSVSFKYV